MWATFYAALSRPSRASRLLPSSGVGEISPWWALAGVVLGAALSYAANALSERARWNREAKARWEQRQFDAIVAYARSVKMQSRTCLRIAGGIWPSLTTNPIAMDDGRVLLDDYEDARSGHWEQMLLLADTSVLDAARAWQQAVWRLHLVARPGADVGRATFEEWLRTASERRDSFYEAVRADLGVGGSLSAAPARASADDPTWGTSPALESS